MDSPRDEPAAGTAIGCDDCGTTVSIGTGHTDFITFDVQGNGCRRCNASVADGSGREPADDHVWQTVRVWWADEGEDRAQWQLALENAGYEGVRPIKGFGPPPAEPPGRRPEADCGWRDRLAPLLADAAETAWQWVSETWRPYYCRILEMFADLLDIFWSSLVAEARGASRLVVRLTGLPSAVSTVLRETAALAVRSARSVTGSVAGVAELYRAVESLYCAGTGNVSVCSVARQRLGVLEPVPTVAALQRLAPGPVLLALTGTSDLPTLSSLLDLEPAQARARQAQPVSVVEPAVVKMPPVDAAATTRVTPPTPAVPPPAATRAAQKGELGLERTISQVAAVGDTPRAPSTFGQA